MLTHTARLVFTDGHIERREMRGEPRERIHLSAHSQWALDGHKPPLVARNDGLSPLITFRRHGEVAAGEVEYVEQG